MGKKIGKNWSHENIKGLCVLSWWDQDIFLGGKGKSYAVDSVLFSFFQTFLSI